MRDTFARIRRRADRVRRNAYRRLRTYLIVAVQAGLAAAIAWVTAREVLGNPEPTFAPAAAVGVIAASLRHRARRTLELVLGVVLGIGVGDLLVYAVGTGLWQTAVIVFLAVAAAVLVRGTSALMTQAGGTAVLVATLTPTSPDLELPRTINALIGGLVGLLVVLVVAPLHPLRTVRRAASPALDLYAREMTASADAFVRRDARAAEATLDRMRDAEPKLDRLDEMVEAAGEVVRLSPIRWRSRRVLGGYRHGAKHMARSFRNSRALVRRIGTTLRHGEPMPEQLPAAVEEFGEAVRLLRHAFLTGGDPTPARDGVLRAVRAAGAACRQDMGFSGTIVVSQLRTAANDLLRAVGVPAGEARRLVRRAAAGR